MKFVALYLTALPPAIVALAADGLAQFVSIVIAAIWLVVPPLALYFRWAAWLLPALAAGFVGLSVLMLPFNSIAFVVDVWSSGAMFFMSLPRAVVWRRPQARP